MNHEVVLAGHASLWKFHGSTPFARWLSAESWNARGDLAVMRVPGATACEDLAISIRRELFGRDAGAGSLRYINLLPENIKSGLREALYKAMLLGDDDEPPWQHLRRLTEELAARPTVILIFSRATLLDLWSEASEMLEGFRKLSPSATLTFLLLDSEHIALAERQVFDFTVGTPVDSLFMDSPTNERLRWQAYLHHRFAWECGGNLELASRWNTAEAMPSLMQACGDDELLESTLQHLAQQTFNALGEEQQTAAARCAAAGGAVNSGLDSLRENLVRFGLFWRPLSEVASSPTPWLARALLEKQSSPKSATRTHLRSCLVCAPLAHAILTLCFELERRLRAMYELNSAHAPITVMEMQSAFTAGNFSATWYPTAHPCQPKAPDDVWAFASLGEFVREVDKTSKPGLDGRHHKELRDLRNTIAHGHYVCWNHISLMDRLLKSFVF